MEDLIELATYEDDEYGTVIQFLDDKENCVFYSVDENENGERVYNKLDNEVNRILEEKYFSMESDVEYE